MEFPTPWTLELRQQFPYGFVIKAANGEEVMAEDAYCFSTEQNTREDNERGVGFAFKNKPDKSFTTRGEAILMIAAQTMKAKYIVAAVNAYSPLRGLLRELHAVVEGECPRLLDENSGGNARLRLDLDIQKILADPLP
jgi:hypothetical protein